MSSSEALLILDVQELMVSWFSGSERIAAPLQRMAERVRNAGGKVIFVGARFRPGHPEIGDANQIFAQIRADNLLQEGAADAAFHKDLQPGADDLVVYKRRVSAFAGTDLDALLRPLGIKRLIVAGIATSGAVLSTVRAAADLDYEVVVLSDCCVDGDAAVHQVLIEKVFPMTAGVSTSEDLDLR